VAFRGSAAYGEHERRYQAEGAPPDQRCLSYTHDRDYLSQVRRPPCRPSWSSWPRSWANFIYFSSCVPTGMREPACIVWVNVRPFSLAARGVPGGGGAGLGLVPTRRLRVLGRQGGGARLRPRGWTEGAHLPAVSLPFGEQHSSPVRPGVQLGALQLFRCISAHTCSKRLLIKLHTVTLVNIEIFILGMNPSKQNTDY
jgi:hypothetical protein